MNSIGRPSRDILFQKHLPPPKNSMNSMNSMKNGAPLDPCSVLLPGGFNEKPPIFNERPLSSMNASPPGRGQDALRESGSSFSSGFIVFFFAPQTQRQDLTPSFFLIFHQLFDLLADIPSYFTKSVSHLFDQDSFKVQGRSKFKAPCSRVNAQD